MSVKSNDAVNILFYYGDNASCVPALSTSVSYADRMESESTRISHVSACDSWKLLDFAEKGRLRLTQDRERNN